jgi:hypothetical protein
LRLRKPGTSAVACKIPAPLLTPADLPALRDRLEDLIDGALGADEIPTSAESAAGES